MKRSPISRVIINNNKPFVRECRDDSWWARRKLSWYRLVEKIENMEKRFFDRYFTNWKGGRVSYNFYKLLQNDRGFQETFRSNIAMAFFDEMQRRKKLTTKIKISKTELHYAANEAATNFTKSLLS